MISPSPKTSRSGNTLVELVTALAVLALVLTVALRLIFAVDRTLAPQGEAAGGTAACAALLQDVSQDLRAARATSGGGDALTLLGAGETSYAWDPDRGGTVRRGDDNRFYSGVRAEFSPEGSLVRVRLTAGLDRVSTAVAVRGQ